MTMKSGLAANLQAGHAAAMQRTTVVLRGDGLERISLLRDNLGRDFGTGSE